MRTAKLANAGQTCVAPDYVLLPEGDVDAFVAAWKKAVAAYYVEGPSSQDYTSIVDGRHYDRLRGLLDDARAKGARIIEAGASPERAMSRAHTLPPTLVLDVHDGMKIMQEEIFGPVLPIATCGELDDAIAFVNARSRPLALYWFGSSTANRTRVLTRTTSGGVAINSTILHYVQDDLPFGGVGPSGFGAYHGIEGFVELERRGDFRWRHLDDGEDEVVRVAWGRLAAVAEPHRSTLTSRPGRPPRQSSALVLQP